MAATSSRAGNTTWALVIAAIFAYALGTIARDPLRINSDSALHIDAAERILRGGLAHVDAIDTNPPLIMYLTAIPTAIAHATGSHPIPVFLVVVWFFSAATTFAARHLLLGALAAREAIHANLLGVGLALATFVLLDQPHFGQREHLIVFGVLPYLVVRFRQWEHVPAPRAAAIAAGLVAGVAASIKPQLALIVAAPEIYWVVTRRTVRPILSPEVIAATAMAAAYLAHFVLIPEVGEAWFGRWVPLLVSGFAAYNITLESIFLWHHAEWRPVAVAILPFVLRARPADLAWRFTRPLAAATFAAAAVYVLQHKGWPYHAVPLMVLAYVLLALVAAQLLTPSGETARDPALTGVMPGRVINLALGTMVCLAIAGSLMAIDRSTEARVDRLTEDYPLARTVAAHTRENEPVLWITTSAQDPYPLLVQMKRTQASRAMFMFPVALLYHGAPGDPQRPFPYRGANGVPELPEETRFLNDLKDDVRNTRPKLILLDVGKPCLACPAGFSLHEYLERTGFITTALADYSRSGIVDHFAIYLRAE